MHIFAAFSYFISAPASPLRRMAAVVNARRYVIACVCLLMAAVGLRFYNLPGHELQFDEAVAAINSRGDFLGVIDNTRYSNSSPILYPIALWAVQKVEDSELGVRVLPAAASALTVGALLFWMPRLGVGRWAAFLAGLLATLSVAAIRHAHWAREYSVDALFAALLIAGALGYMRDGRRGLLCLALFVAPLVQYGLVLFGAAALGAAAVANAPSRTYARKGRFGIVCGVWGWLSARVGLVLPIGVFGAGCAVSWALTGRYHWREGGRGGENYLADYYYKSGFDVAGLVEFAIGRTWGMLSYHMPSAIAAVALLGFGALLLSWARRGRLDAVVGLPALLAVGVAVCAAVIDAYPLGGIRQNLYLGPIVFLAAGSAFHWVGVEVGAMARRGWLAPAFVAAAAVAIAVAGAAAVHQSRDTLYYSDPIMKQIIAALEELEQEGDAVYVSAKWESVVMRFYKSAKPDNYFYGNVYCKGTPSSDCVHKLLDEMFRAFDNPRRIWLIHNRGVAVSEEMAAHSQEVEVEEIAADRLFALYLITGFGELVANVRKGWLDAVSGVPDAASTYNLYLREDALYYAKRPCESADTEARYFLHIYPEDVNELRSNRRQYGFDRLDFEFQSTGWLSDDKCVIRRALPDYAIERIHTGQFVYPDGAVLWEVELPLGR